MVLGDAEARGQAKWTGHYQTPDSSLACGFEYDTAIYDQDASLMDEVCMECLINGDPDEVNPEFLFNQLMSLTRSDLFEDEAEPPVEFSHEDLQSLLATLAETA